MRTLSTTEALRARWSNHLLGGSDLTPAQVVDRSVALQGQDLPAVLRAIALRSRPGTSIADVRAAFDRGELVRSWPGAAKGRPEPSFELVEQVPAATARSIGAALAAWPHG
ncbi:hypothetical protein [Microbacterium amylolyticum]|uniref:Winged helix DNA-binding domain-containing protein n=1 Tax=Microbacterium amylolyticum TaxID=936337 RepID=A0ABS4ZHF9_9MICO|nr:hypothetical protein [Microbacterium amylolyticum]MBP2436488.1 hypothetical protein [Microbacterium amylolyticum]